MNKMITNRFQMAMDIGEDNAIVAKDIDETVFSSPLLRHQIRMERINKLLIKQKEVDLRLKEFDLFFGTVHANDNELDWISYIADTMQSVKKDLPAICSIYEFETIEFEDSILAAFQTLYGTVVNMDYYDHKYIEVVEIFQHSELLMEKILSKNSDLFKTNMPVFSSALKMKNDDGERLRKRTLKHLEMFGAALVTVAIKNDKQRGIGHGSAGRRKALAKLGVENLAMSA